MNIDWESKIEILDFAFQEIIDVNTGMLYGVEALLRNYREAGFESICSVFDMAYNQNYLYSLDLKLREKAIKKLNKSC
jgi:EAL domain-containing protein (putative c-di-GMP-specific phosphodiesterase class I)